MADFISRENMRKYAESIGILLDETALSRFNLYAEKLVDATKNVNLTRIVEPEEIVIRHFIDSLELLASCKIEDGTEICDIGTGGGFPGIPLLIVNPRIRLTMMDSTNKKLEFVRFMVHKLGLNANVVTSRAEDAGRVKLYREKFDLVTARAVAQLNVLCEYCIPLVKVGGRFAPLKARLTDEERENGIRAAEILGMKEESDRKYCIPDGSEREIIVFKKEKPTNGKYPRNMAQISKKPL